MRGCYKDGVGPWFDWLFVSPDELRAWAPAEGWEVEAAREGTGGEYCALLKRRG